MSVEATSDSKPRIPASEPGDTVARPHDRRGGDRDH